MSAQSVWFEEMVELAESLGWIHIVVHLEDDGNSVDGVFFTSNEELAKKVMEASEDMKLRRERERWII